MEKKKTARMGDLVHELEEIKEELNSSSEMKVV
jgi:hypothetical protein